MWYNFGKRLGVGLQPPSALKIVRMFWQIGVAGSGETLLISDASTQFTDVSARSRTGLAPR
jgi:hypothetical protein